MKKIMSGGAYSVLLVYTLSADTNAEWGIQHKKGNFMRIISDAFQDNGSMPVQYTCDDKDISPALSWKEVPSGTKSFVLICDDPDAPDGSWIHWLVFNIPAHVTAFKEAAEIAQLAAVVGRNSWGKNAYGGPCPPDSEHRYVFTLYALDCTLTLSAQATKYEVTRDMKGHILDQAHITVRYKRKQR